MTLDNLVSLSLTNCDEVTIDFEEGVLPVLAACGEHLKNLILTNFAQVNVSDVGRTCPKLQNVAFARILVFHQDEPCSQWFNDLEAMELWCGPEFEIDPNVIRQLVLYSPNIKNLLFNECCQITDQLFSEIMKDNPMKQLSHMTLDHCYNISSALINKLLDVENNLSVVRVWSCPIVGKEEQSQIAFRIKQENMDVYFDWYQYDY